MILKINIGGKSAFDWVYFDNVQRIEVRRPNDYAFTQIVGNSVETDEEYKVLRVCGLSTNCTKEGKRRVIENSRFHVDEYMCNQDEILDQHHVDDKGDKQYWGVKLLFVYPNMDDSNMRIFACYDWNEDIYLLNDKGETLERL